uniref:Transmembrane protein 138 n=1 Tax=Panagrolaimus sp. JU765 TaxID=591449 RepID=A0AC34REL2_9BILA
MSSKYSAVLALHILLICVDLGFNTASTIVFNNNNTQLLLFILQDTAIVMSIIVLLIAFTSTFVFQAGLILILIQKFAAVLVVATIYLILSITLHVVHLRDRWGTSQRYIWPVFVTVLYTLQRLTAILHYFFYKRAALFLSDPRFHYDNEWLREQVRLRN